MTTRKKTVTTGKSGTNVAEKAKEAVQETAPETSQKMETVNFEATVTTKDFGEMVASEQEGAEALSEIPPAEVQGVESVISLPQAPVNTVQKKRKPGPGRPKGARTKRLSIELPAGEEFLEFMNMLRLNKSQYASLLGITPVAAASWIQNGMRSDRGSGALMYCVGLTLIKQFVEFEGFAPISAIVMYLRLAAAKELGKYYKPHFDSMVPGYQQILLNGGLMGAIFAMMFDMELVRNGKAPVYKEFRDAEVRMESQKAFSGGIEELKQLRLLIENKINPSNT